MTSLTLTLARSARLARVVAGALLLSAIVGPALQAQGAATTIILVRHGEKSAKEGDVPLSAEGQARAAALARVLKDAKVGVILTSATIRTRQTAAPLAKQLKVTAEEVPGGSSKGMVARLDKLPAGSVALVVHHSNTVPEIVTGLGAGPHPTIEDTEFDRLVIVTRQGGATHAVTLRYGAPSIITPSK